MCFLVLMEYNPCIHYSFKKESIHKRKFLKSFIISSHSLTLNSPPKCSVTFIIYSLLFSCHRRWLIVILFLLSLSSASSHHRYITIAPFFPAIYTIVRTPPWSPTPIPQNPAYHCSSLLMDHCSSHPLSHLLQVIVIASITLVGKFRTYLSDEETSDLMLGNCPRVVESEPAAATRVIELSCP